MKRNLVITCVLTLEFILLGIFVFKVSYLRFFESVLDLFSSIQFFFCKVLKIETQISPTVTEYSNRLDWELVLPKDFNGFKNLIEGYFSLLFTSGNFVNYLFKVAKFLSGFAKILVLLLPCAFIVVIIFKGLYKSGNNKYNKDTVPLKIFKFISGYTYAPLKRYLFSFISFLKVRNKILIFWGVVWAVNLNIASIVVSFFAYYLYFAVSFKVNTLYVQFLKLCIDLQVSFKAIPLWTLIILAYVFFYRFRVKIANSRLRHFEARNCGFINELPIVTMTCGSMGKKKTTIITDMALSQEVMLRQRAFEIIQNCDMKFPFFPWICFERDIKTCIEFKVIYNLASIKNWINKKRLRFENNPLKSKLYGYDYIRYGITFDDKLRVWNLFDVLETYAKAYFIYIIQSSLIVSNYSIRSDNLLLDEDNFPIWATDFFPKDTTYTNRHSHILDFDTLRLGKKVVENNALSGSFEFGVVVITEIGKERGNNLELKEVKKNNESTNQKNDLFNSWLKMCRHSATVDNFPFIKVFCDEQRPESWGADARDLADVLNIISSGEQRLALPFYTLEEMITEFIFNRFIGFYYDLRYRRGDNTLLVYILKAITAWLYKRNVRVYNNYGYSISRIEKERGTLDGKIEKKKYFVMNKKIYNKRFSTDCFSDYFNELAKNTKIGLNDYMEYATEKATLAELKTQNSYFINALYKDAG